MGPRVRAPSLRIHGGEPVSQQHTPGPWKWSNLHTPWNDWALMACDADGTFILDSLQGTRVRGEHSMLPLDPDHPDARLIAAGLGIARGAYDMPFVVQWYGDHGVLDGAVKHAEHHRAEHERVLSAVERLDGRALQVVAEEV